MMLQMKFAKLKISHIKMTDVDTIALVNYKINGDCIYKLSYKR